MSGKTLAWLFVSQAFSNSLWIINYVDKDLVPLLAFSIILFILLLIISIIESWDSK